MKKKFKKVVKWKGLKDFPNNYSLLYIIGILGFMLSVNDLKWYIKILTIIFSFIMFHYIGKIKFPEREVYYEEIKK